MSVLAGVMTSITGAMKHSSSGMMFLSWIAFEKLGRSVSTTIWKALVGQCFVIWSWTSDLSPWRRVSSPLAMVAM